MKKIIIPADQRNPDKPQPLVTNEMKAACMGEFSWTEEADYYDEDGGYVEHNAERIVPWDLCKTIYKTMALVAAIDSNEAPSAEIALLREVHAAARRMMRYCGVDKPEFDRSYLQLTETVHDVNDFDQN